MIKNLTGVYETVEYENKRVVMLHDNVETEAYPIHWHNAVEIIIPLTNDFTVISGDKEYVLKEKEILIIPPGELHSMPAREGRRIFFQCDNTQLGGNAILDSLLPVFSSSVYITPEPDKELYLIARKGILDIYSDYYSKSPVADAKIYMNLLNILTAVRESQLRQVGTGEDKDNISSDDSAKLKYVMNYINHNFTEELSLDTLAEIAGYSKFHFSRLFKKYNNMSCVQYISCKRIKMAEQLLCDPTISITEIAMRSGFLSLTTFNRIFKAHKNCTPSEFRRLYKTSDNSE
ncbi:MAG: helix-turn-helix domain-containing protein [Ruminococcus sp.]|jgi:AraC-like DNA-binding protein|nr:helix-turn-helix domain-containing protein [Ruminococcus sp.]